MNRFILLAVLCPLTSVLCSCAGPRLGSVHYSPPSAAPVRTHITTAQDDARAVKDDLRKLGIMSDSADQASRLSLLNDANKHVDALTYELTTAQTALKDYETKVADQTSAANRAIDEKNAAITARDKETAKAARIAKREHFFFLLLSGALIWIFRTPLLALLKILLGLATKLVAV